METIRPVVSELCAGSYFNVNDKVAELRFFLFVEQRYHAYFMTEVDSWIIISAGLFSPCLYMFHLYVKTTNLLYIYTSDQLFTENFIIRNIWNDIGTLVMMGLWKKFSL